VQFARDNPSVNVVGIGAGTASNGDSLETAYDFVARHGTDAAGIAMLYDVSFQSWRKWGVRSQPYVVLVDAQGNVIFASPGRVDMASVEAAFGL